jgi:glycosyltransferase involved in cell wall biosynthesis
MGTGPRLTILSVAYPFAPVGPDAVGGAEQVLSALDQALVAAGHRSIVVACAGSVVAGELLAIPPIPEAIEGPAREAQYAATRAHIATAVATRAPDLIHLHGVDFAAYLPRPGPPVLATLHLPPEWYPPEALLPGRPNTWLNCVSRTQHRALLACLRPHRPDPDAASAPDWILPPIGNGVPVAALAGARHARRGCALVLGRICREKGQHLAIDAARLAGVPLLLAGQVFPYPEHQAYFAAEIQPRLHRGCRLIGPVGFARKRRLLTAARCVLLPSQVAETSSLVAMEALACGTPVIAFPNGALPEIVEHGRTGFLVRDVREMADAIGRARSIDPEHCRQAARERFALERTTAAYLELHRRLAASAIAPAAELSAAAQ